ncbi:cell division control protein 6 [Pelomyxa schiedti]|nr:cell division control protein 6 [Pelomyxa schiedti]
MNRGVGAVSVGLGDEEDEDEGGVYWLGDGSTLVTMEEDEGCPPPTPQPTPAPSPSASPAAASPATPTAPQSASASRASPPLSRVPAPARRSPVVSPSPTGLGLAAACRAATCSSSPRSPTTPMLSSSPLPSPPPPPSRPVLATLSPSACPQPQPHVPQPQSHTQAPPSPDSASRLPNAQSPPPPPSPPLVPSSPPAYSTTTSTTTTPSPPHAQSSSTTASSSTTTTTAAEPSSGLQGQSGGTGDTRWWMCVAYWYQVDTVARSLLRLTRPITPIKWRDQGWQFSNFSERNCFMIDISQGWDYYVLKCMAAWLIYGPHDEFVKVAFHYIHTNTLKCGIEHMQYATEDKQVIFKERCPQLEASIEEDVIFHERCDLKPVLKPQVQYMRNLFSRILKEDLKNLPEQIFDMIEMNPIDLNDKNLIIDDISHALSPNLQDLDFMAERPLETQQILRFIDVCLKENVGGCLSVTGSVGLGKSHTLIKRIPTILKSQGTKLPYHWINSCNLYNSAEVYTHLHLLVKNLGKNQFKSRRKYSADNDDFHPSSAKKPTKTIEKGTATNWRPPRNPVAFVVDEVDNLAKLPGGIPVINVLFKIALEPSNRLILMVCGNRLDFSESRAFSALRPNEQIVSVAFKPYSAKQLYQIILYRLQDQPVFNEKALEFCCKEVVKFGSDVRKALTICRSAVQQYRQQVFDNKPITFGQMRPVVNYVLDTGISRLPFHEQAILCSAAYIQLCKPVPVLGLKEVYTQYHTLMDTWHLPAQTFMESFHLCQNLSSQSLISWLDQPQSRQSAWTFSLCVSPDTIREALANTHLLNSVLVGLT